MNKSRILFCAGLLTSLLTFFSSLAVAVNCTPEEITLSTQAEVNDFQTNHGPGCDNIVKKLTVSGLSINDLTPLAGLKSGGWTSAIYIDNTSITSLTGLEGLVSTFRFEVKFNTLLTDVSALSGRTVNQGPLNFTGNSILTNLNGLSGITTLDHGALTLQDNPLLSDISGLSNLNSIGASLVINDNDSLQHVDGLSSLTYVASNINISFNDGLLNLDGLGSIAGFDATFDLRFNSKLASIPTFTGWTNLYGLILYYNAALQNINGLAGLETIGNQYQEVWIKNNDSINSLDGLVDLVSIDGGLDVSGNGLLDDCDGLIKVLNQTDDALPGPGPGEGGVPDIRTHVIIESNLPGCDSIVEITGEIPPPDFLLLPDHGGLDGSVGIRSLVNPDNSCDWSPGETIEFWWDTPEQLLKSITVDEQGCFTSLFLLDSEKIGASTAGSHQVEARGSVSGVSSQGFEQVDPQLLISPAQGAPGRVVTVQGCHWDGAGNVEVTWLAESQILDTLLVDGGGCIDSTLKMPREKNGLIILQAESDNAQSSAAAYQIFVPVLELTPGEGPDATHIPAFGCNWFPQEVIEYKFAFTDQVIDTGGTNHLGCLAPNSGVGSSVFIPPETPAGDYVIQATGQDSNLRARTEFKVVERSLEFDPPEGMPGATIAVSGCGWVGNIEVRIEWGYPDTNNQPITWNAPVDAQNGCFGLTTPFEIIVPANTITGPLEQTATGDEAGTASAEFMVTHGGTISFPTRDGVVGHSFTVNIHDAIVGESIILYWTPFHTIPLIGVGATSSEFSVDITLPASAALGNEWLEARGTKGFRHNQTVNIIDASSIQVTNTGDIAVGTFLDLEGQNWSAKYSVSIKLISGQESYFVGRLPVPSETTTFSGSLALPTDIPAGDYTVEATNQRGYKSETSVTLVPGPLPAFGLSASFAETPPALDGVLSMGEWDYQQKVDLSNGFLSARNDDSRLYLLLNLLGDTTADPLGNDSFWISFDVLESGTIDAGWDLNFRLDGNELVLDGYKGPDDFEPKTSTFLRSAFAAGFNCFTADNSAEADFSVVPPILRCDKHRVYEIGIELQSILARAGDQLRIGIRAQSQTPSFTEDLPENFHSDFSDLGNIQLADSRVDPTHPTGSVTDVGVNGFELEVTQATQDADNSLDLVADKATAVRVYTSVASEALVRTYLFGRRNGQKLQGSPLVTMATVPSAIDRDDMAHTSNFLLPDSWVREGRTELQAVSENAAGDNTRIHVESFTFNERLVPRYWIIPINSNTAASPTLVADDAIALQQSYLETVFPLHDVIWTRKGWSDIGAVPIGSKKAKDWLPDVNDELNDYYDDLMISHATSLEESGQEPFILPDQVYGFTAVGGGLSDPAKYNGERRVSSGFFGTSGDLTMAHEINHNLDSGSPRSWGKHTTDADDDTDNLDWGCGAEGGNTSWPRTSDEIGETGFDTRTPWQESGTAQLTVVPANWPDFMSYCRSAAENNVMPNQLPFKWTSEYRWAQQFLKFSPPFPGVAGGAVLPETVYYVSGILFATAAGTLDPVRTQPGTPSVNITPGDYSLEIQTAGGAVLWSTSFDASFVSEEGDELEQVYFRYRLPFQESGAKIVLKHLGSVLDTLEESANPPVIELISPSGGEIWGERVSVIWTADDADGDDLTFSLLYSPDDGDRWYPVASDLVGTDHTFFTPGLPGGTEGKLRLIATDGFNTVTTDSYGLFTVPGHGPKAVIELPLSEQVFRPGEWVPMRGSATVPDGNGENLSFAWFLDGEVLDMGPETQAKLEEGYYALSLVVYDSEGNTGTANVSIRVTENDPPNEPILPLPMDGSPNEAIDTQLRWLGGDPDGDAVTYDVYLEAVEADPFTLVCDDAVLSECQPGVPLVPTTLYYWKVMARDDTGLESESETWSFTTGNLVLEEEIFADSFE